MKCAKVWLIIIGSNTWECPFWVLFDQPAATNIQIEHIAVNNISRSATRGEFSPCAIITTLDMTKLSSEAQTLLSSYILSTHIPSVSIYRPAEH